MFKKLARGLDRRTKAPCKIRFDVQITSLENIPAQFKQVRIVWSRGAKVQYTKIASVNPQGMLYFISKTFFSFMQTACCWSTAC